MAESQKLNKLNKKDEISGKVVGTSLSGAAVDIGLEKPAVIPISQLRKEPVRRVEEVLKKGDMVDAWVRRIHEDAGRVELTLIKPLDLEWREIKKGMTLKGKVSKIENFGAFVEVGAERPGLVHVSELSHDYVRNPEDAVSVGDEIEVQVLGVDRRKKQIKLSVKALSAPAEDIAEEMRNEEPAPTAMESALRKAMDKDESSAAAPATKEEKAKPADMDDILTRTLENRVKSK